MVIFGLTKSHAGISTKNGIDSARFNLIVNFKIVQ